MLWGVGDVTGTVDVDGVPIAVEDPGGPGRPLVWAHGLTSGRDHEDATGLFRMAAAPGLRVVRYDAPGHGASGGRPDDDAYRWDRLPEVLLAVQAAAGLERSAIGGASMGCATSLFAALAHPGRVEALVLAVPPTAWESRPAQAELYRAGAALVADGGPGALAEVVRTSPVPPAYVGRAERLYEISAATVAAMDGALLPHVLRGAAASDLPPESALAAIDVPTLVLALAGDPTHPVATAERLTAALPRAELHVAADVDQVSAWPERVGAFLAAHP